MNGMITAWMTGAEVQRRYTQKGRNGRPPKPPDSPSTVVDPTVIEYELFLWLAGCYRTSTHAHHSIQGLLVSIDNDRCFRPNFTSIDWSKSSSPQMPFRLATACTFPKDIILFLQSVSSLGELLFQSLKVYEEVDPDLIRYAKLIQLAEGVDSRVKVLLDQVTKCQLKFNTAERDILYDRMNTCNLELVMQNHFKSSSASLVHSRLAVGHPMRRYYHPYPQPTHNTKQLPKKNPSFFDRFRASWHRHHSRRRHHRHPRR